mgnify:CR=1 FL=1
MNQTVTSPIRRDNYVNFRTGNHFLPVETGRWEGIDITDRTCALCENVNEIASEEYHYILICPFLMNKGKHF